MKQNQIVAGALVVALVAWVMMKKTGAGGGAKAPGYVLKIKNPALPSQEGFGWQYFSDGTAISPGGDYYQGGDLVWSPAK